MNKLYSVLLIFLMGSLPRLYAQDPGYSIIANEENFKLTYKDAVEKIQSISSEFTQEKNISLLDDKIISKGLFYFKKPDRVRMEYTSPYKYLLIMNDEKILIKDEQKTTTYSVRNNKLFESINRTIIDGIQGTILENKNFSCKIYENEKQYLLLLVPVDKAMLELFSTIKIYIDKNDHSVNRINLIEQSGDNTIMTFVNKQINKEVSDAIFSIN